MLEFLIGIMCGSWLTLMIAGYLWDKELEKLEGRKKDEKNKRQ